MLFEKEICQIEILVISHQRMSKYENIDEVYRATDWRTEWKVLDFKVENLFRRSTEKKSFHQKKEKICVRWIRKLFHGIKKLMHSSMWMFIYGHRPDDEWDVVCVYISESKNPQNSSSSTENSIGKTSFHSCRDFSCSHVKKRKLDSTWGIFFLLFFFVREIDEIKFRKSSLKSLDLFKLGFEIFCWKVEREEIFLKSFLYLKI